MYEVCIIASLSNCGRLEIKRGFTELATSDVKIINDRGGSCERKSRIIQDVTFNFIIKHEIVQNDTSIPVFCFQLSFAARRH